MKDKELYSLVNKHPLVAMGIFNARGSSKNNNLQVFLPNSTDPEADKYYAFCSHLNLKNPPFLVVLNDTIFGEDRPLMGNTAGNYHPPSNTITVPRRVFEAFNKGDPWEEYVLTHELSHRKYHENRRGFLGKSIGFFTAGVVGIGAGAASKKTTDAIGLSAPEKITPPDAIPAVAGIASAVLTGKKILAFLNRMEEFAVDQYAAKTVGKHNLIKTLCSQVEELMIESCGEEEVRNIRAAFDREIAHRQDKPTGEALELAYAAFLADNSGKIPMREIWKDPYPSLEQRLSRLTR